MSTCPLFTVREAKPFLVPGRLRYSNSVPIAGSLPGDVPLSISIPSLATFPRSWLSRNCGTQVSALSPHLHPLNSGMPTAPLISLDTGSLGELLEDLNLVPPEYTTTAYDMRTAFLVVNIHALCRDPGISMAILACQDAEGHLIVLFLNQRRCLGIVLPYFSCTGLMRTSTPIPSLFSRHSTTVLGKFTFVLRTLTGPTWNILLSIPSAKHTSVLRTARLS